MVIKDVTNDLGGSVYRGKITILSIIYSAYIKESYNYKFKVSSSVDTLPAEIEGKSITNCAL